MPFRTGRWDHVDSTTSKRNVRPRLVALFGTDEDVQAIRDYRSVDGNDLKCKEDGVLLRCAVQQSICGFAAGRKRDDPG